MTLTRGLFLVLGVNPFVGVRDTGFVDGDCPWDLSLGQLTGTEEISWGGLLGGLWMVFLWGPCRRGTGSGKSQH